MRRCLVPLSLLALISYASPAIADVDDFEDLGANFTVVSTRVIAGVTVTLDNARGWPFLSVGYHDTASHSFLGAGDLVNAPDDPGNVSGSRFVSTADDINRDMPLTFSFDSPLGIFGLTTIDVLEDVDTSPDAEVRLRGYNGATLVAEHVMTGIQGPSGVTLQWQITSAEGITRAELVRTAGTISAGYGFDDMVVVPLPVASEAATFGRLKALYR